jgi:hypothetical protein
MRGGLKQKMKKAIIVMGLILVLMSAVPAPQPAGGGSG